LRDDLSKEELEGTLDFVPGEEETEVDSKLADEVQRKMTIQSNGNISARGETSSVHHVPEEVLSEDEDFQPAETSIPENLEL
jgi:hypothetical protein